MFRLTTPTPTPESRIAAELRESSPATLSSDAWFAQQAATHNVRARTSHGNTELGLGGISLGLGVTGIAEQVGFLNPYSYGASNVASGIRHRAEANLIQADTAEKAKREANTYAIASAISIIPSAILTAVLTGSTGIGLIALGIIGIARLGSAYSTKKQVELIGQPESASRDSSDRWFREANLRELPRNLRQLERYWEQFKRFGSYGLGIYSLFTGNFLGAALLGINGLYSGWKYKEVLPPVIDYYDRLHQKTNELATADNRSTAVSNNDSVMIPTTA